MKKEHFKIIPYIIVSIMLIIMGSLALRPQQAALSYDEFINKAKTLDYQSITIDVDSFVYNVSGEFKDDKGVIRSFDVIVPKSIANDELVLKDLLEVKKDAKVVTKDVSKPSWIVALISNLLPLVILVGLAFMIIKTQNVRGHDMTGSKAKRQKDVKVRFSDVAGCKEEKEEVSELVDYLKNPTSYDKMGARIPKGMLMVGPPGTGKTLLAKAVAGEAKVPFFSISGSDFVELFVGAGAGRVRSMFKEAKKNAPCIIFIDEIDAVGRQRGAGLGGGNDEREQTLNQLLVEMDGMQGNTGILIIAATNRADVLDPALLRSGRFDRQIRVSLPDVSGREEILEVHARDKKLAADVSLKELAQRTPGFSGADLENVLNEGSILAVREKSPIVTMAHLDEAIDRVMMGPAKKSKKYTPEEKRLVAWHEAGHAIIGLKLKDSDKVNKITIIPRGDAGGYNLMLPDKERYFPTKSSLLAQITGYMGGRVSEEIVFNEISAGASNDIERATKIAKAMVCRLGMSKLGPIQYATQDESVFLGRDYNNTQSYSDKIAHEIDEEVRNIITECYENARKIINENRDLLDLIANTLLEKETITRLEIQNLERYGSLTKPQEETEDLDTKVVDEASEEN